MGGKLKPGLLASISAIISTFQCVTNVREISAKILTTHQQGKDEFIFYLQYYLGLKRVIILTIWNVKGGEDEYA